MSAPFEPKLTPEEWRRRRRQSQEEYLRARGWVRLVDRADIWVNVRAEGVEIHSVHLFRAALALEKIAEDRRLRAARRRERAIHHHPGRED